MEQTDKTVVEQLATPGGMSPTTLTLDVQLDHDGKKQPLKMLRPYAQATLLIPSTLPAEAQIVLHGMLSCFDKNGNVQEGLVGDILFGFEHANPSIPRACSFVGLTQLQKRGFIKFQAPDNELIDENSDKIGEAWVRYQAPLLALVYSTEA